MALQNVYHEPDFIFKGTFAIRSAMESYGLYLLIFFSLYIFRHEHRINVCVCVVGWGVEICLYYVRLDTLSTFVMYSELRVLIIHVLSALRLPT